MPKFLIEIDTGAGIRSVTLECKDQQTAQTWGSKQAFALNLVKPKIRVTQITPEAAEVKKVETPKEEKKTQPRKKKQVTP